MRTLGVTCTPKLAHLTVAVDGAVVEGPVNRVEVASLYEASTELLSTLDEIKRALAQLTPDAMALLLPERQGRPRQYVEVAPRAALETLIRIAAVQLSIPIEVLPPATLRSRLGIGKSGALDAHLAAVIPTAVGPYWGAGRGLAGLAALAAAREGAS